MEDLRLSDLTFCQCFLRREIKKLIANMVLARISSEDISTVLQLFRLVLAQLVAEAGR